MGQQNFFKKNNIFLSYAVPQFFLPSWQCLIALFVTCLQKRLRVCTQWKYSVIIFPWKRNESFYHRSRARRRLQHQPVAQPKFIFRPSLHQEQVGIFHFHRNASTVPLFL